MAVGRVGGGHDARSRSHFSRFAPRAIFPLDVLISQPGPTRCTHEAVTVLPATMACLMAAYAWTVID